MKKRSEQKNALKLKAEMVRSQSSNNPKPPHPEKGYPLQAHSPRTPDSGDEIDDLRGFGRARKEKNNLGLPAHHIPDNSVGSDEEMVRGHAFLLSLSFGY